MSAIFGIIIAYIAFNIIAGFFLAIYYFSIEKKIIDGKELATLLFFPAIGFGTWLFNKTQREKTPTDFIKEWYIYKYMLKLNWVFVFAIIGYEIYAGFAVYTFFTHYEELKSTTTNIIGNFSAEILHNLFGWMFNLSIYIVLIFFTLILLFTFVVCFLVFILFPKLKLKDVEKKSKIQH